MSRISRSIRSTPQEQNLVSAIRRPESRYKKTGNDVKHRRLGDSEAEVEEKACR